MKNMIVLLTALAVLCSFCACRASDPADALSQAGSKAEDVLSEAEDMLSEAGSAAEDMMTSLADSDDSTGLHEEAEVRGPASLSYRYVTVRIPEGIRYSPGREGTQDSDVFVTLYADDPAGEKTFFLTESRTVSGSEDAVAECIRLHADTENGDVSYGEDMRFGDTVYKSVHLIHEDGSASDYLVTALRADDGTALYAEMKVAEYPTGNAFLQSTDPLTAAFLESLSFDAE